MLELSMIHRPGLVNGRLDFGRIIEAMLYYDRVHLIISGQMFVGLWDILGPDDFRILVGHHTITTTLTSQMLAIHNDHEGTLPVHLPVAIKTAGREGKLIHQKDDVGSLLQMLQGLTNKPRPSWAQVNQIVKLTKVTPYSKILGSDAENYKRIVSLARDQETLKLFLRGWALANGKVVNEIAFNAAETSLVDLGTGFIILSTVPLDAIVRGWNPTEHWGTILTSIQDYAADLYLSNYYSADIVTTPEVSEVASARVDISLKRATNNAMQISAFEEMVFEEAHSFADAVNSGLLTFSEALNVIDKSRKFRSWTRGLAPDANLVAEYHKAITRDTVLQKLPFSLARFSFFNGTGMLADAAIPGTGLISSAIDTFIVERLVGGWRPNVFVRNMKSTLETARQRAAPTV